MSCHRSSEETQSDLYLLMVGSMHAMEDLGYQQSAPHGMLPYSSKVASHSQQYEVRYCVGHRALWSSIIHSCTPCTSTRRSMQTLTSQSLTY